MPAHLERPLAVSTRTRLPEINRYHDRTASTPLVPVRLDDTDPTIWCKLEFLNPSGSTKADGMRDTAIEGDLAAWLSRNINSMRSGVFLCLGEAPLFFR